MKGAPKGISKSFAAANPRAVIGVNGDAASLDQLTAIGNRSAYVKLKARSHFHKFEETWVVKEAMTLFKQRSGLSASVAALPPIAKEYTVQSTMAEARRNVRARMTQRLTKINGVATRMSNTVVRNLQNMQPTRTRNASPEHSPSRKGPSK